MAASMLRHRPSSLLLQVGRTASSSAAPSAPLRGGQGRFHGVVGAGSSSLPPPAMAMAASAWRHLSTSNPSAPEEERRRQQALAQVEAAKAELLRQLMLEDATADKGKLAEAKRAKTEELAEFLRRQVQVDAAVGPVAPTAEDRDKHLLLALLLRSTRAEHEIQKLRSSTTRAEHEIDKLRSSTTRAEQEMEKLRSSTARAEQEIHELKSDLVDGVRELEKLGHLLIRCAKTMGSTALYGAATVAASCILFKCIL